MYRSLSKYGALTEYSYDRCIRLLHITILPPISFLGRNRFIIHQDCRLVLTYSPAATRARCTSRRLARRLAQRRGRTGRWPRRLCSFQQTRPATNSFLAHQSLASLCLPKHVQKRRSATRSGRDEASGRTRATVTSPLFHHHTLPLRVQVNLDPPG